MSELGEQLLGAVESDFTNALERDRMIAKLRRKIDNGGTWADAEDYAARLGELKSRALQGNITAAALPEGRMSRELAEEVLTPALEENYRLALEAAAQVQEGLNEAAGIGMKAVRPKLNTDRIRGITERIGDSEDFEDVAWLLGEPVVNFTQAVADETLGENVEAHAGAGLSPKIIRIAEGDCCKWCSALEGEYDYPPPEDVYRRHENCRCQVLYQPAKGQYTDVHTKKQFETERDARIAHYEELSRSGGSSGAKKTEGWKDRHAERYYEEVRNRAPYSDARKIAQNVQGFTADEVEEIRQHVFIREQPRDGGLKRFDPDYKQSQAWQRLVDGKDIRQSDVILLQHERLEASIMEETGCTYEEAHAKAEAVYNWVQALIDEEKNQ